MSEEILTTEATGKGAAWGHPLLIGVRYYVLAFTVLAAWMTGLPDGFVWVDHVEIENGGYRVVCLSDLASVWTQSLDQFLERHEGQLVSRGGYLRPVYALSLSLDWALWGNRPWFYHVENVVWHMIVVCGLYCLGRQLLGRVDHGEGIVFWSTLLFAVHPLGVHSVTWISGRKDLMCAAFSVMSLLAFARTGFVDRPARGDRPRPVLWAAVSVSCLLLALLSKELAFVVPVYAGVWWWFVASGVGRPDVSPSGRASWICLALLWSCAGAVLVYRVAVLGSLGLDAGHPASSFLRNAGTYGRLMWCYVASGLLPTNPSIVDRWPVTREIGLVEIAALLGWLLVIGVGIAGLVRRWPFILLVLWYVIWMIPASGILPLRHLYAERYLYPATWGMAGLVVFTIFRIVSQEKLTHRWFRSVLLCGIALSLALRTTTESRYWWSDESLFSHAIQQDPNYVEGRAGLAALALSRQDYEKAVEHSQIALKSARDTAYVSYWSPFVIHTNLGLALYHQRRYEEAGAHFEEARQSRPGNARAHYHVGLNSFARRDIKGAERHYSEALRLKPGDFLTQSNLGYLYLSTTRFDDCIRLLQPLVLARPDDLKNRENLGTAYLLSGRYADAELQFKDVVLGRPKVAVHLAKLAWAVWKQQKAEQALKHLWAAVEIQPDHPTVRHVAVMILKDERQQGESASPGQNPARQ